MGFSGAVFFQHFSSQRSELLGTVCVVTVFAEAHSLGVLKWVSIREMHQNLSETYYSKAKGRGYVIDVLDLG